MQRIVAFCFSIGLLSAAVCGAEPPPSSEPGLDSPAAAAMRIPELLRQRVLVSQRGVGIVVGELRDGRRRVVAYGSTQRGGAAVGGDTLFEIGSVTKVLTATLLADMALRGEVALDEELAAFLPPGVRSPVIRGRQITLRQLATHTSGLPTEPQDFFPRDPLRPYADLDSATLFGFLERYRSTRPLGSFYEYSNLGYKLLGHALERRADMPYGVLLRRRVLEPLGMRATTLAARPAAGPPPAAGHSSRNNRVPPWQSADLPASGGLRSTANDLLAFAEACLGLRASPLDRAIEFAVTWKEGPDPSRGFGWLHMDVGATKIVWHNGRTGGFSSFFGFVPQQRRAIVVLSNSATPVDNLGLHLLDVGIPLHPPDPPEAIVWSAAPTDAAVDYLGSYRPAGNAWSLAIARNGEALRATFSFGVEANLGATGRDSFASADGDHLFSFSRDEQGRVAQVHWRHELWRELLRRQ